MRRVSSVVLATTVALWAGETRACPGCQNPNLPMARGGDVNLTRGEMKLGLNAAGAPIWVTHDAGCADPDNCDEIVKQPEYAHDQFILPMELRASFDWGFAEAFGLEVGLPFRVVTTGIDYQTTNGDPYEPLDEGVHHRNETLYGLSDPTLATRFSHGFDNGLWLLARVGVSLPVGKTVSNPFEAGEKNEKHQHIQFGTGTFDPLVGLELARAFGKAQAAAYGQVHHSFYENGHEFQAGTRSLLGAQGGYRVADGVVLQGSAEWLRIGADRWDGEIRQDGLLGRNELLLGVGGAFTAGRVQYTALLRFPVYRRIEFGLHQSEAGDLTAPVSANLGVAFTL